MLRIDSNETVSSEQKWREYGISDNVGHTTSVTFTPKQILILDMDIMTDTKLGDSDEKYVDAKWAS